MDNISFNKEPSMSIDEIARKPLEVSTRLIERPREGIFLISLYLSYTVIEYPCLD
jgi:hypothetical protein